MDQTCPEPGATTAGSLLTVIVPVYDEESNLALLHERLTAALIAYGMPYEILFVDDGSRDRSFEILRDLHARDDHVRVLRFTRNFGQQVAISAGFQSARGDVVVLIDADLQAPPEDIPRLVQKLREGYDIVYGVRRDRVGPWWRRMGSWAMSHLLYRVTGIDVPDSASGFTALDRGFVNSLNLYSDKTKYYSGLFAWLSYGRWASVEVHHAPRHAGQSKYSFAQLTGLTFTFICNFTTVPLRIAFHVGWAMSAGALLLGAVLAALTVAGVRVGGATAMLAVLVLLSCGLQLTAVGVLGEYLGRVYREVREHPLYVVREVLDRPVPPVT